MTISELSVRRPVLMTMVYAVIIIIAVMFLPNLQISLYPSVSMPMITVMVSCTGAGPEEIESQVTEVLENSLSSVKGLESMTSRSSRGSYGDVGVWIRHRFGERLTTFFHPQSNQPLSAGLG